MRHSGNNALIPSGTGTPTKEGVVSKAVVRVATNLGLSQKELSEIVGPSKSEISRLFNGTSKISQNTKQWECAVLLVRLYRSLDALLGEDERQCQEWFQSYNHHLGEKPIILAKKIEGLVEIVIYLDAVRGMA